MFIHPGGKRIFNSNGVFGRILIDDFTNNAFSVVVDNFIILENMEEKFYNPKINMEVIISTEILNIYAKPGLAQEKKEWGLESLFYNLSNEVQPRPKDMRLGVLGKYDFLRCLFRE